MNRFVWMLVLPVLVLAGCRESEDFVPEVIFEETAAFSADGGEFSICFSIKNPFEYAIMRCRSDQEWVHDIECLDDRIVFVMDRNTGLEHRSAHLTVTYPECPDMVLTLTQDAYDQTGGMKIDISVELEGARSAVASFSPLDPEQTYYTGCTLKSDIDSYGSDAAFMDSLVEQMRQEAESSGLRLNAVIRKYVVTGESSQRFDGLQPESDYCAFAFSLDIDGTFGDNLTVEEFRSGGYDYPDAGFDITISSVRQNSAEVTVTPDFPQLQYYMGVVPVSDYENSMGSDELLVASVVQECSALIEYYASFGITWTFSNFTETGQHSEKFTGLIPAEEYYAFAFGLDEAGFATTPVTKTRFSANEVEITDDCTFELTFSDITSQSFDVTVVPSNAGTRYYVYVAESKILDANSAEDVAALLINMADNNGINWGGTLYIWTGERTLDTAEDLNTVQLQADTEYMVFVFGVSNEGERTTEVAYASCRTAEVGVSDMKITLSVSDLKPGNATVTYTPDTGDYYLYGCVSESEYESYPSDAAFMDAMAGQLLGYGIVPVSGQHTEYYDGSTLSAGTDYIAYAFGYSGGVNTALFKAGFSTPQRQFSSASLVISSEIIDGNDVYQEDPVRNEDFKNKAAVVFTIAPDGADSWFFSGFGNSLSYLQAMDTEELFYSIYTNGRGNYNKTTVRYAVAWNSVLCGAGYGIDTSGNEGRPVLVEVQVPPSAAYLD